MRHYVLSGEMLKSAARARNEGHKVSAMRKKADELRSHRWFGSDDMRQFGHHSRIAQMGYSRADYIGKPIIAVINTWSDINACHSHFRQRAEEVKRGVLQAGIPTRDAGDRAGRGVQKRRRCLPQFAALRLRAAVISGRWRRADGRLRQDDAGCDAPSA
jgi:hypothetical protein